MSFTVEQKKSDWNKNYGNVKIIDKMIGKVTSIRPTVSANHRYITKSLCGEIRSFKNLLIARTDINLNFLDRMDVYSSDVYAFLNAIQARGHNHRLGKKKKITNVLPPVASYTNYILNDEIRGGWNPFTGYWDSVARIEAMTKTINNAKKMSIDDVKGVFLPAELFESLRTMTLGQMRKFFDL